MTETEDAELASAIEAAVRAIPGVKNVYRSGSLVSNLVDAAVETLGIRASGAPLVSITRSESGVGVDVSIGVDAAAGAAPTVRETYGVIGAVITAAGATREDIRITVVHIHENAAATGENV